MSLKHLSLVAVLSQEGDIKWLSSGDFTKQQDPGFEEGSWITVFDNRTGVPSPTSPIGTSMIRRINPKTNEIQNVYPAVEGEGQFYTFFAGKHQKLANGNRLITEALAGRVFEITPEGDTVWEWIIESDENNMVPEVMEVTRYSYDAQQVASWPCSTPP